MRIISVNLNGANVEKRKVLGRMMEEQRPNIVLLQETLCVRNSPKEAKLEQELESEGFTVEMYSRTREQLREKTKENNMDRI